MRSSGEHGRRVIAIPRPIPQQQSARDVAFGGGELCGKDAAADLEPHGGIAERGERGFGEAVFARDLAHDLHQSPGKCAGTRLGWVVRYFRRSQGTQARGLAIRPSRRQRSLDIFRVEGGLITQRPGIPGRLLLDDGADEFGPKRMRFGRPMRERDELRWGRLQGIRLRKRLKAVQAACVSLFGLAVQLEEAHRRRVFEFDAVAGGDAVQGVIDVRQMIERHVADEGAFDGGVAQAAMQPAKEDAELSNQGEGDDQPIRVHCSRGKHISFSPAVCVIPTVHVLAVVVARDDVLAFAECDAR